MAIKFGGKKLKNRNMKGTDLIKQKVNQMDTYINENKVLLVFADEQWNTILDDELELDFKLVATGFIDKF